MLRSSLGQHFQRQELLFEPIPNRPNLTPSAGTQAPDGFVSAWKSEGTTHERLLAARCTRDFLTDISPGVNGTISAGVHFFQLARHLAASFHRA